MTSTRRDVPFAKTAIVLLALALAGAGCSGTNQNAATPGRPAATSRPAAPNDDVGNAGGAESGEQQQSASDARALTEDEKIDALLDAIAASGNVFVRNGSEATAEEAADHLRMKRSRAGSRVKTARDFIDGLASKSSLSGKPYQMRLADGTTVATKEWLDAKLAEIESGGAKAEDEKAE